MTVMAKPFNLKSTIMSEALQKFMAQHSIGYGKKTLANLSIMTASPLHGQSVMKNWSPIILRPSICIRSMESVVKTRQNLLQALPILFPPVSNEPRIQQLNDNFKAAGYHPFPAPCAIMLNEKNMPFSKCIRCQTCDGFPCLVHAKADAEMIGVRPAIEFPNVTLMRNAKALKLNTNPAGTNGH